LGTGTLSFAGPSSIRLVVAEQEVVICQKTIDGKGREIVDGMKVDERF
jgi:hypothetical protein